MTLRCACATLILVIRNHDVFFKWNSRFHFTSQPHDVPSSNINTHWKARELFHSCLLLSLLCLRHDLDAASSCRNVETLCVPTRRLFVRFALCRSHEAHLVTYLHVLTCMGVLVNMCNPDTRVIRTHLVIAFSAVEFWIMWASKRSPNRHTRSERNSGGENLGLELFGLTCMESEWVCWGRASNTLEKLFFVEDSQLYTVHWCWCVNNYSLEIVWSLDSWTSWCLTQSPIHTTPAKVACMFCSHKSTHNFAMRLTKQIRQCVPHLESTPGNQTRSVLRSCVASLAHSRR